ncbi:MAG: sialate O-acetylesterase [bacterium]
MKQKTMCNQPKIWVLAGQSNMAGCGALTGAPAPDERVMCLTGEGWVQAAEPLHGTGVGPGLAFGVALAEATGDQIGLIPCAMGGTSLAQWSDRDPGTLYDRLLSNSHLAGSVLAGVLWYQGESDSRSRDSAASYGIRLEHWIAGLRADLQCPDLPVLLVQLGRYALPVSEEEACGWNIVRETLRVLPTRIPHTAVTSAVDLGLADIIHLDTPSLVRVGQRLARLACGLPAPDLNRLEQVPVDRGLGCVRVVCRGVTSHWPVRQHISGFTVHLPDGSPHPTVFIINAAPNPIDPSNIHILLNQPPDATVRIGYGLGSNPNCNAVDDADMPMPAFAPQEILS